MPIRTYRDLEVLTKSYAAALEISKLTKRLPQYEQFELGKQLRRAARSIPANIVEGWAKRVSVPEFKRYLQSGNRLLRRSEVLAPDGERRRIYSGRVSEHPIRGL